MKQLDEMERMAREWTEEYQSHVEVDTLANDLARALLAVMPTIRAAIDWHRVNTGQHTNGPQHTLAMRDTRRALVGAIDELRRRLGGE